MKKLSRNSKRILKEYRMEKLGIIKDKKDYMVQNRWLIFIVIAQCLLWVMFITGNLFIEKVNAKYFNIYGGEDHDTTKPCTLGTYENTIEADLLANDIASSGSIYGWYMGCDGTFYMRGLIRQIRPLTKEEEKRLKDKKYVREYAKYDKGTIWGYSSNEQKYIFMKENKLLAYIDDDGLHGLSEKDIVKIKKQIKEELLKELSGSEDKK